MSAPADRGSPTTDPAALEAAPAGEDMAVGVRLPRPADAVRDASWDELAGGARIVFGAATDHALIEPLLVQCGHPGGFGAQLDEPTYQPSDRLLVRRQKTLVGHVRLARHVAWFEEQRVGMVRLNDFAVLPEFCRAGYAEGLLAAAEGLARREGAVAAVLQTAEPDQFAWHGWSLLRGQGHTRADVHAVLAHLDAQHAQNERKRPRNGALGVRAWRHFELDEVIQVYSQAASGLWGAACRSDEYWQWLVAGAGQDELLLAVEPTTDAPREPSPDSEGPPPERVVGYAVVRGASVAEMMTLPGYSRGRALLVARMCHDAVDQGRHAISIYTPATDPLHELLVTAGGAWIGDSFAQTPGHPRWMIKLLTPEKWVERMYPLWQKRARESDVPRPLRIDFVLQDSALEAGRFTLTRRSSRWETAAADDEPATGRIECAAATRDSLLLGNLAVRSAIERGQLSATPPELADALVALFSPRLFWQSPLDWMRG